MKSTSSGQSVHWTNLLSKVFSTQTRRDCHFQQLMKATLTVKELVGRPGAFVCHILEMDTARIGKTDRWNVFSGP